jgi:hypothetical protein
MCIVDEDQDGAMRLWGAVEPGDAEFQVDRMTLDVICNVVLVEMITALATKDSTLEAWESIIRKASVQKVRREYEVLDFHDGEGV